MPIDLRKYRNAVLIFVILVFLHSLRYFDYVGLDVSFYGQSSKAIAILLILICIISKSPKRIPGQFWFLAMVLVPMMSFLPSWLENGQSPMISFKAYLFTGMALVYFLLHKAAVSEKDVVYAITALALLRLVIYIIQQFTYPDYLFSFRPEGLSSAGVFRPIEVRSGIYRFYIEDTYLSMFLVFYYLQRFIYKHGSADLLLFFVGLIGVYLDQSRQFMASTAVAIIFVLFFGSRIRHKKLILFSLAIVVGIVLANSAKWFEDLIYMTQNEMTSSNIRLLAYTTYGLEFWGGPLSVIFGNGPVGHSAYGDRVDYLNDTLHIYQSDVGLVGAANLYGLVTVLLFLAFYVFFVARNWRKMQLHIKMYFTALLINAPLVTIFTQNINWFVFFGFMLFFTDRSILRFDRRIAFRRLMYERKLAEEAGNASVS